MVLWSVLVPWPPLSLSTNRQYLAATFQFHIWSKSMASRQIVFSLLPLGFPTCLLPLKHPPITFWGIENHPSLLHGQPTVVSSGIEMLEVPRHHTICR